MLASITLSLDKLALEEPFDTVSALSSIELLNKVLISSSLDDLESVQDLCSRWVRHEKSLLPTTDYNLTVNAYSLYLSLALSKNK